MTKARLITLLLTLALAFAATPAALAQEEDAAFDPSSIPEVNQDEALILYLHLREKLLAAGVSEGDLPAAVDWLGAEGAELSETDVEQILGAQMLADATEGEMGDDEFGQAEEDEPELGDDEEEEESD